MIVVVIIFNNDVFNSGDSRATAVRYFDTSPSAFESLAITSLVEAILPHLDDRLPKPGLGKYWFHII